MKTIEQIAIETANTITAPYITDESLTRFATKFLEAWLAQQEPVAWLVGSVIDSFAVKGYETYSEADAKLCDGFPVFRAPPTAKQEPVAHVYLHDIQQSRELGTYAPAYPVPVGTAFNKSVPVFLAPPTSPEGWQPIETAPKDGTRVLITGWGNTGVAGFENDAWCFMNDCWVGERVPTHWQPLPPPPPPGEKK